MGASRDMRAPGWFSRPDAETYRLKRRRRRLLLCELCGRLLKVMVVWDDAADLQCPRCGMVRRVIKKTAGYKLAKERAST